MTDIFDNINVKILLIEKNGLKGDFSGDVVRNEDVKISRDKQEIDLR